MSVSPFDMGAPEERIKNYHKGLIIKNISAKDALSGIMDFLNKRLEKGFF